MTQELLTEYRYRIPLLIDMRALPSCAEMLDRVNGFMHECGFRESLVAFIPLSDVIIKSNRRLTPEEERIVFAEHEKHLDKLTEKTGHKYKLEPMELIG
jgi:hypothetical protein